VASSTLTTAAPVASGTPTHPTYATWASVWRWLVYVYEGSGPFLDGRALIAHPREFLDHTIQTRQPEEHVDPDTGTITFGPGFRTVSAPNPNPSKPSAKLLERRKLARYENVASPIVDHKLAALLRRSPTRRVKGDDQEHDWLTWAEEDVDGAGTTLDDFMRDAERLALIFGHAIIVMDRVGGAEEPLTRAQQGSPALRLYSPLDAPDWLQGQTGELTAIKLYEVAPRTSLDEDAADSTRYRLRYLTPDDFKVVEETTTTTGGEAKVVKQETLKEGNHGFGRLPVVVLYAKRRALTPLIGQSVLYDPQLYVDLYNLTSELRELLRKQTFSILNIPLGTGPDALTVEQAQAYAGQSTGTTNVLFSGSPAQYITADASNVTVYLEVIKTLLRTIYRLSNVPFESDSKDAEAEGSLALKREDMNQVLAAYASEMQRTEMMIAQLWFRGTYGEVGWKKEWERVQPTVVYPETFDVTPFAEILEQTEAALALPLGDSKTFMVEVAKQVLPLILNDAPQSVIDQIHKELAAVPTPEEKRKQDLDIQMARFGASFEAKPGEEPPQEPAA
jgi:hypothetical protein